VIQADGPSTTTKKKISNAIWNANYLISYDFPELGADLVAALACLDVDDLTHVGMGVSF
jgi:hypothetical protein